MALALIEPHRGNRIVQVVPDGENFPVAAPLQWVNVPDEVTPETHTYDGKTFSLKPTLPRPPVVVDPTPGTLDVIEFLADEGIVDRARLKVARPEWDTLLENHRGRSQI